MRNITIKILSLGLVILPLYLVAEQVYKQEGADGRIIFSDTPTKDSEPVKIKESITIKSVSPSRAKNSKKNIEASYTIAITSPKQDDQFRDNPAAVTIAIKYTPSLEPIHSLKVSMDGQQIATTPSVTLSNVERGAHTITANIVDKKDKVIASAPPITFNVFKHSVLNRAP